MAQNPGYSIQPLTDCSLLVCFGNTISPDIHEKVLQAYHSLKSGEHPFITNLVPAYSTLGVIYDMTKANDLPGDGSVYTKVAKLVFAELTGIKNRKLPEKRCLRVPVCYAPEMAPDLEALASSKGLSIEEVAAIHCSATYDVFMLGFLPGFAYMGIVDPRIAAPRKTTPRTSVPKGSVGIAGNQTGIYPSESPGGWQLIGRTPVELFIPSGNPPSFFLPGDEVKFYPITKDEFENY